MKRRDFLTATAALSLLGSAPALAAKKQTPSKKKPAKKALTPHKKPASTTPHSPPPGGETRNVLHLPEESPAQWRSFDLRTQIELKHPQGKTRLWLPLTQYRDNAWERSLGHSWQGNFCAVGIYRDPVAGMEVLYADWPETEKSPALQVISRIATQDRHFDITRRNAGTESTEILRCCLQSTQDMPVDGIVRRTAEQAVGRIKDPVAVGKAIYDWVVEHAEYASQGAGRARQGVGELLADGRLAGKSHEITLLFVALCRSIGLPARPVFGLRMGTSRLSGNLGILGELNAAQHCRAEFYAPGYGWIPVDPADVLRASREGDSTLATVPRPPVLKKLLFGFWEMNWVGFNSAQDIALPGSSGAQISCLDLPVAENDVGRFDARDSGHMTYSVTASRVEA